MAQIMVEGLDPLIARGLVQDSAAGLHVVDADMLHFYAASVLQRVRISAIDITSVDRIGASP
jgi:hypothetical protein